MKWNGICGAAHHAITTPYACRSGMNAKISPSFYGIETWGAMAAAGGPCI